MTQLALKGIPQIRTDLDQYFTPPWLAEKMVRWGIETWRSNASDQTYRAPVILEPCAGHGAIVRAALDSGAIVIAYENDQNHANFIRKRFVDGLVSRRLEVHGYDYLSDQTPTMMPDLCIVNPPYSADVTFMARIMGQVPIAIALLRTVFLNGVARWNSIWSGYHLARIAHLKRRPSFGGPHTPKVDFSVFDIRHRPSGMTSDHPHIIQMSWW
jgi:hypothetical protein